MAEGAPPPSFQGAEQPGTPKKNHCLLFPRLDMDLAAFLRRDDRYGAFRWDFTFFSALCGLASALHRASANEVRSSQKIENKTGK